MTYTNPRTRPHQTALPGQEVTAERLEGLGYHKPFRLAASHLLAAGYRVTIRARQSMAVEIYQGHADPRLVASVKDGQALADLLGLVAEVGE